MECNKIQKFRLAVAFVVVAVVSIAGAEEKILFSSEDCGGICVSDPVPGAFLIHLSVDESLSDTTEGSIFDGFQVVDFDVSPDGKKIAFLSYNGAQSDIWVMNSDGTDLDRTRHQSRYWIDPRHPENKEITLRPWYLGGIAWSPDGSEFLWTGAFVRGGGIGFTDQNGRPRGYIDHYPIDGIGNSIYWSALSGDIVFSKNGIVRINREGDKIQEFDVLGRHPHLSPDETKLSFSFPGVRYSRRQGLEDNAVKDSLFVMDMETREITFVDHGLEHDWSPDSQRLVYGYWPYGGSEGTVFIIDADGTNQVTFYESQSYVTDIEWVSIFDPSGPTGISPTSWGAVKNSVDTNREDDR